MDVPGTHSPAIEWDDLLLNPGDIPLVFGDNLRLELAVPVPGDVDLELPILALELFGGMAVALVGAVHVAFLVLFIAQCRIQLCLHKFLQDVLESIPQQGVDVCHTTDVVVCNNLSNLFLCYWHINTPFR